MSYQEERLQEIADAIREVKGTTEKIPATNFASEIVGLSVVKPSGIITIKENGSHNVANYEWAEVNVEAGLREKDIIGTWASSDGFSMLLQPNGVANVGGVGGTYEIFGNQVIINVPEEEPITLTYNSDTETLTFETLVFSRVDDIREKDIVGKWLIAEGSVLNFKTGGVVLHKLNGIEASTGTYEISGINIIATLTGFLNTTFYFNYNEETDTLYDPYLSVTATRVQEANGLPIEATTDQEMTNALVENNLGKVYKFTGTSDTYDNNAIYIIEEI